MLYTPDVVEFIHHNHAEVKKLVSRICFDFSVPESIDDIIQEFYTRCLTRNLLSKYNPEYPGSSKISTYLYRVLVNLVKASKATGESQIERSRFHFQYADCSKEMYGDEPVYDEIEMAINTNGLSVDYKADLYANYAMETVDGLDFDFNMFEKYLKKTNRKFTLSRRRCKNVKTGGITLLDVFQMMRNGASNRDIARQHGVSVMFITTLKLEIKDLMIKFGIVWETTQRKIQKKSFC